MRHGTIDWSDFSRKYYTNSLNRLVHLHAALEKAFATDKYLNGLNLPIYLCVEDLDYEYQERAIRLICGDKRATVLFKHITGLAECVPTNQAEQIICNIISVNNRPAASNPESDASDFYTYVHIKTVGIDYSVLMQADMFQSIERHWVVAVTGDIPEKPYDENDAKTSWVNEASE